MAIVSHSLDGHAAAGSDSWLDFTSHSSWLSLIAAIKATPGVADICVNSRGRVRLKVRGDYRIPRLDPAIAGEVSWKELCQLINPTAPEFGSKEFSREGGCRIEGARFRFSRVRELFGEEFTLRVLPEKIPAAAAVHLPTHLVDRFVSITEGLVFFAGGTGHGKSTSIAALISENARRRPVRVVTIEDPVEYLHEDQPNGSTFTYREVGASSLSFADALKDAMRMNPDIIVVGEIRDSKSAEVALNAALTGHKVVSTIHGGTVEQAMQRLGDLAGELGESAIGALAQAFRLGVARRLVPRGRGPALIPLHEILTTTASVCSKIRTQRLFTLRQDMESGKDDGMQTFDQARSIRRDAGLIST